MRLLLRQHMPLFKVSVGILSELLLTKVSVLSKESLQTFKGSCGERRFWKESRPAQPVPGLCSKSSQSSFHSSLIIREASADFTGTALVPGAIRTRAPCLSSFPSASVVLFAVFKQPKTHKSWRELSIFLSDVARSLEACQNSLDGTSGTC